MADPAPETCLTRDELLARYGQPERVDSALPVVLADLDLPFADLPPGVVTMTHRYPSVEAFEAYKIANLVRNHVGDHCIAQLGPAVIGDGVYGVILITPEVARG